MANKPMSDAELKEEVTLIMQEITNADEPEYKLVAAQRGIIVLLEELCIRMSKCK